MVNYAVREFGRVQKMLNLIAAKGNKPLRFLGMGEIHGHGSLRPQVGAGGEDRADQGISNDRPVRCSLCPGNCGEIQAPATGGHNNHGLDVQLLSNE